MLRLQLPETYRLAGQLKYRHCIYMPLPLKMVLVRIRRS